MVMVNFQGLLCWGCMGSGCMGSGFPYCRYWGFGLIFHRWGRRERKGSDFKRL